MPKCKGKKDLTFEPEPVNKMADFETLETDTKVMRLGLYWLHFHKYNWFNDSQMKVWLVVIVPKTKQTKF